MENDILFIDISAAFIAAYIGMNMIGLHRL
jgi:hypothetical protein